MNAHLGSGGLAREQQSRRSRAALSYHSSNQNLVNQSQQSLEPDGVADYAFIAPSSSSEGVVMNQSIELWGGSGEVMATSSSQGPFGRHLHVPSQNNDFLGQNLVNNDQVNQQHLQSGQNHRRGQGAYQGHEYYYNTRALYPTASPRPRLQVNSVPLNLYFVPILTARR